MPPEHTSNETQPPTSPPTTTTTTTSPLYLEQLEQAISTPVPDLASTLATPESRSLTARPSAADRPSSEVWNWPALAESQGGDNSMSGERVAGPDLAESLDRMQSELDRWQTERDRLRTFLSNQQNRQLALEEQNSRLRRQHSRLAEENSRLYSTAAHTTSLPREILGTGQSDTSLSNLATAIAEVGRESYSTSGSEPIRQRLYDWAAQHSRGLEQYSDNMSGDQDSARHRELEHALRSYRSARNTFRSERPSSDFSVPTAAALRAYWTEDERSVDSGHLPTSHLWAAYRRDRQQRTQHRTPDSPTPESVPVIEISKPVSLSDANALKDRIRNTIRYLSKLRNASPEDALSLARYMDLDVLYECQDSNAPSNLPLLSDSLPKSEASSWLTPGMTWHGLQSTDREHRPSPSLLSSTLRMVRQREYFGRSAITRRGMADAQNAASSFLRDAESPNLDTMDSDRYLSSLMRDPDGRWGFGNSRVHTELPASSSDSVSAPTQAIGSKKTETDHWPVTVALHTVDMENMVVTGTMRASQIPDRTSGNGRSMESYFHGEIIDFRKHSLETDSRRGYKVGGVDVDARYWSRLGPFKEAIQKQASRTYWESSTWEDKLKTGDAKYWEVLKSEEQAHRELEADRVMMRCLGNQKWLQEKLGHEWILMRWKEKCFVDPILNANSVMENDVPRSRADSSQTYWGLTISGFYYVALHRQNGTIDGLYYDPGSQPYQSLRMEPEGTTACGEMASEKPIEGENLAIPVKRWFPSIEFR